MTGFTDAPAKVAAQALCDKRNQVMSRFHPLRWRPLWTPDKGWHCELRPNKVEVKTPKAATNA
jgi:hypothetical protein